MTMSLVVGCRARIVALAAALGLAAGCASRAPAPIAELGATPPTARVGQAAPATPGNRAEYHVVKKGETLYGIALEYGQDYRDIVAWNNLENPNVIRVGQSLRVAVPRSAASAAGMTNDIAVAKPVIGPVTVESRPLGEANGVAAPPASNELLKTEPKGGKRPYSEQALAQARFGDDAPKTGPAVQADLPKAVPANISPKPEPAPKSDTAPSDPSGESQVDWTWPSKGKLLAGFSDAGNKGVDFSGKIGDPVFAAAGGEVIFAKDEIRGFGNLVIIKHSPLYISVYAHNSRILVKEKQAVTKGQKIAELGSSDTDKPRLHFEIRRQGKPVDPIKYLPQL